MRNQIRKQKGYIVRKTFFSKAMDTFMISDVQFCESL